MDEPWTPGPWNIDGVERDFSIWGVANGVEVGSREAICFDVQRIDDARLISLSPDLVASLEEVTRWLEGSDLYGESHGAHTAAVEARKLITKARGDG